MKKLNEFGVVFCIADCKAYGSECDKVVCDRCLSTRKLYNSEFMAGKNSNLKLFKNTY